MRNALMALTRHLAQMALFLAVAAILVLGMLRIR
jgi:hypothetical protein